MACMPKRAKCDMCFILEKICRKPLRGYKIQVNVFTLMVFTYYSRLAHVRDWRMCALIIRGQPFTDYLPFDT